MTISSISLDGFPFVLILIQIMTAEVNHTLSTEMKRFQEIFERGDGVNGAEPLTITKYAQYIV